MADRTDTGGQPQLRGEDAEPRRLWSFGVRGRLPRNLPPRRSSRRGLLVLPPPSLDSQEGG